MNKRVKVCLALFLALAVIAQYSFSPQVMIAYGEDGEVAAASEESSGDDGQTAEKKEAEKPAPAPEQKTTEAPAPAPAASSDSSDTPEPAESAAPAEENDSAEADETSAADDVDVGEEEPAVDEEEALEEEEEEGFPAQDFSGEANGVSVKVSAPKGALPEGTKMSVKGVSADQVQAAVEGLVDGEVANLKAVDISFKCDGKEIEPKKAVSVHMTASGVEADKVVHIADSGNANVVGASTSGSSASFKSADFSVYIVVDEEISDPDENAVATYKFYVGNELKNTQYIKSGDSLEDPGALAGDGANTVFKGWYVKEGQTIEGETPGAKLTFGKKDPVPATETIEVEAKVQTTYYVTFWGEPNADEEDGPIVAVDTVVVEGEAGTEGTLDISGRSVTPRSDTSAFEGWAATKGGEKITDTTITVTESTDLYAIIVAANWIRFDENVDYDAEDYDGSDPDYTGPVYVKKTDDLATKKPADPQRKGYTFGGWYKEAACTNAFEWSGTGLEKDITLYAEWIPGEANYSVIIWKQKVTDDVDAAEGSRTYDFEASYPKTGTTGETLDASDFSEYAGYTYTGFHYGRTEIDPTTVRADGTTVVNVYYDRNVMTILFYDGGATHTDYVPATNNSGNQFGLIDGEYIALTRHGNGFNVYWTYPETQNYSGAKYSQAGNTTEGTQYGFVNGQMVQLTYHTRWGGYWTYGNNVYYNGTRYVEGAAGSSGYGVVDGAVVGITLNDDEWVYTADVRYEGDRYVLGQVEDPVYTYRGLYGAPVKNWPSDRAWYNNPGGQGTRLTFLDAYKFEGLSGVSEDGRTLTQYGDDLSGRNPIRFFKQNIDGSWPANAANTVYTTTNSNFTITEKYEGFKVVSYRHGNDGGWTNVNAGATVGGNNLNIRFERQKYTLTFISDGDVVGTKTDIPYEDVMNKYKIDDPEKKHYVFAGWCEDPEGKAPFNWSSTMPAANKVLYAKWTPKQYNVKLDANGGTLPEGQDADFNVPLDTVLSKTSLFKTTYDVKHELVGWFYKTADGSAGDVYEFGKIESNVSLIAKWRIPGQVSIIYDADGHASSVPKDNYKYATDSAVVLGAPPTGIETGYTFVGWKVGDTVYYTNNTFDITEELIGDTYDPETKTGTITVTAVYNKDDEGPFQKTHIYWYKNDGSTAPCHTDGESDDLLVNQPVGIQGAPERDGYEFLGWAKIKEDADGKPVGGYEQNLGEDDLFIKYENGAFKSAATGTTATQVAGDELRDYEALFAVWKCKTYTVTWKTQDGNTELEKDTSVPYNTQPSFDGTVPTKAEDTYYTYSFAGWAKSANQESGTAASSLPKVTEDATYYVAYSKTEKTVTINYVATTGGTVDPETETVGLATGTVQGSTATPANGYKFVNWTDDSGTQVSTNAKYVPDKKAATYTAYFEKIVEPQTVIVNIDTNPTTVTYNGKEQENGYTVTYTIGEATYSELPEGLTPQITGGPAKGTNKGNYTSSVTVTVVVDEAHSAMYDVSEAEDRADIALTIDPAPASITADDNGKIFGDADPKLTATKKGFFGSDTVEYTLKRDAGEAVGKYPIRISIPGAEEVQTKGVAEVSAMAESRTVEVGNYKITLTDGTFTITAPTEENITPPTTPDDNPGGGNAVARVLPAAAPVAPATIVDEPTPTTIVDEPAPKAAPAYWALINLLCAIATALLSLIMLIRYFGKRKDEEELADPATGEMVTRDVEEQRGGLARIASLIPAIGGIIAFILTEDMSLPMAMVDKWTVLMIVILAIQAGVGIVAKLRDDKGDEDEEAMA